MSAAPVSAARSLIRGGRQPSHARVLTTHTRVPYGANEAAMAAYGCSNWRVGKVVSRSSSAPKAAARTATAGANHGLNQRSMRHRPVVTTTCSSTQ